MMNRPDPAPHGSTEPPTGGREGEPEETDQIVLTPLARTPGAGAAVPVASRLARLVEATHHVVLLGRDGAPPPDPERDLGIPPELLHGAVLERRTGPPARTITRLSREWPTLAVVLAVSPAAPDSETEIAAPVEEVLRDSSAPVVLVPPTRDLAAWDPRLILVPHDGTPTTAAAVGLASRLARRAEAELVVLHVVEPGAGQPTEPGTFTTPRYVDQPQHEWPAWAREFLNRCCAAGMPYTVPRIRILLTAGEPGAEIVRYSRDLDADLVVLGWHGRLDAERARTMKTVVRAIPCPILVLRLGE